MNSAYIWYLNIIVALKFSVNPNFTQKFYNGNLIKVNDHMYMQTQTLWSSKSTTQSFNRFRPLINIKLQSQVVSFWIILSHARGTGQKLYNYGCVCIALRLDFRTDYLGSSSQNAAFTNFTLLCYGLLLIVWFFNFAQRKWISLFMASSSACLKANLPDCMNFASDNCNLSAYGMRHTHCRCQCVKNVLSEPLSWGILSWNLTPTFVFSKMFVLWPPELNCKVVLDITNLSFNQFYDHVSLVTTLHNLSVSYFWWTSCQTLINGHFRMTNYLTIWLQINSSCCRIKHELNGCPEFICLSLMLKFCNSLTKVRNALHSSLHKIHHLLPA